jgi:predicted RNA-binding Zn-ribbon protein involved in translation (DUF1610 family)
VFVYLKLQWQWHWSMRYLILIWNWGRFLVFIALQENCRWRIHGRWRVWIPDTRIHGSRRLHTPVLEVQDSLSSRLFSVHNITFHFVFIYYVSCCGGIPISSLFIGIPPQQAAFVSCKDKTPKEFQSSVVYKFSCPGCGKTYIGKTDRCLYTRLNEHAITDKNSEIYKHINTCEQFNYLTNLLQLNIDEPNTDQFNLTAFLLNNCNIIDRAKHWSNLLFKEALAIHRQKPELNHGTKASRELSVFP